MGTEVNIEMIILGEVGVGLGIDNFLIILEGMIKAVVGLEKVQELAPIENGLDAVSVGNMIILLRTVQLHEKKRNQNKYNRTKSKQH